MTISYPFEFNSAVSVATKAWGLDGYVGNWNVAGKLPDVISFVDQGLQFVTWKLTYGSGTMDESAEEAIECWRAAGVKRVGGYHWEDPTQPMQRQADGFLKAIDLTKVQWAYIDWEQRFYWTADGSREDPTRPIPNSLIESHMDSLVDYLTPRIQVPLGVYTGAWYTYDRTDAILTKLKKLLNFLSNYLDYGKAVGAVTWDEFHQLQPPSGKSPDLPKGVTDYLFWQDYTRMLLPNRRKTLWWDGDRWDQDILNGPIEVLDAYIAWKPVVINPVPPAPVVYPRYVTYAVPWLTVRVSADEYSAKTGKKLYPGTQFTAYKLVQGTNYTWAKISQTTEEWVAMSWATLVK